MQDLRLHSNQLSGSIPPQLGNLANLQFLQMCCNQLSGSIPPELSNLAALLILTALPLASTTAPRLEPQPSEPLTALNSTEATESDAPLSVFSARSVASVVQSPSTTTRTSTALRGSPTMFIENVRQFDERIRLKVNDDANRRSILAYFPERASGSISIR